MVSAILLLGGSASISALTGMDIRAATMLLPVGVIAYVIVGGLRSTFVSDYVHTTIVFIIIWLFLYTVSIKKPSPCTVLIFFLIGLWIIGSYRLALCPPCSACESCRSCSSGGKHRRIIPYFPLKVWLYL